MVTNRDNLNGLRTTKEGKKLAVFEIGAFSDEAAFTIIFH